MILSRYEFGENGIFGTLSNEPDDAENDTLIFEVYATLEHAYLQTDGTYLSKIPNGSYKCVRGVHQLEGMTHCFETFEITGIEGHNDILFHQGNYNKDSAGCVLLGKDRIDNMIMGSALAFGDFMDELDGIQTFQLTVTSK